MPGTWQRGSIIPRDYDGSTSGYVVVSPSGVGATTPGDFGFDPASAAKYPLARGAVVSASGLTTNVDNLWGTMRPESTATAPVVLV